MTVCFPASRPAVIGIRYTSQTCCDAELNYDKVFYLYYEGYGQLGRWCCIDEYVAADVIWDETGKILPTCFYINNFRYQIGKRSIIQMYPMFTRKTDDSGMRYIVKASCRQLRDYNREFSLMLENVNEMIGRWFYEDADIVRQRKVAFKDLDDDSFNMSLVEESMGGD